MLFSSPIFLFLFLPIALVSYFLIPLKLRNFWLLLLSLVFYSFGEGRLVLLILGWTGFNYLSGLYISRKSKRTSRIALSLAIIGNLAVLGYFKYLDFALFNFSAIFPDITTQKIYLPLAVSFFTFHAISYNIDIFRRKNTPEKNLLRFPLYMLLFPHLLAGPIVRYHQIKDQLTSHSRVVTREGLNEGISRFIIGLSKKVLIADTLSPIVNEIFAIPSANISTPEAWLGVICFTLQIYFDFSGYSDMAIGMARIFGFTFPENFNYPYISSSIREFWRRWHITLYLWFRDYLYIPLGGNRKSSSRTIINVMIVFLLCGLWHGANWTFIVWGGIHGLFIALETIKEGKILNLIPQPLKHVYLLLVVIISWVFFRSTTLDGAIGYLKAMFGFNPQGEVIYRPTEFFLRSDMLIALTIGGILALSLHNYVLSKVQLSHSKNYPLFRALVLMSLLSFSVIFIAAQTFNTFIYFRF